MGKSVVRSFKYPPSDARKTGEAVCWLYYRSKAAAIKASNEAIAEACYRTAEGYGDYGCYEPGNMVGPIKTGKYAGMYEVCAPY
jgi:hypothetical protein